MFYSEFEPLVRAYLFLKPLQSYPSPLNMRVSPILDSERLFVEELKQFGIYKTQAKFIRNTTTV